MADKRRNTLIAHGGLDPERQAGFVNPPVARGSTVLFPTLAAFDEDGRDIFDGVVYGRRGTPVTFALERAIAELDGGHKAIATCSGLAAITVTLGALLASGDGILVCDNAYGPTRRFCEHLQRDRGIDVVWYDPAIGAGIRELIRPETRVVFMEAPGSHTFEMQDVPAIAAAARDAGAISVMDNTWATPLFFRPLEHGVDVSLMAATKYIVGHSDAMLGLVTVASEALFRRIKGMLMTQGVCAGSEEAWLGLRGLRTLDVRLRRHQENAMQVAEWLQRQPRVARVMYPALPDDPGHALWRRDFSGASGLLGFVPDRDYPRPAIAAFIDGLRWFGIGASWGGFESLVLPFEPAKARTATRWTEASPTIRLHIGLEDPADLIEDLEEGFGRLARAAQSAAEGEGAMEGADR